MGEVPWSLSRADYDPEMVAHSKGDHTISVVVPAQNESMTIGHVLDAVRHPRFGVTFVDDLIVVDDHSRDDTATVAARHGARVVPVVGSRGKGQAMRVGLAAATGSLVVFLDADVTSTTPDYVPQLVQPLLENSDIQLVKPYYERPLFDQPTGGGRVTELTARSVLSLLFPGLGEVRQPLAGETASRRATLDALGFDDAYGVEIALLIDVARKYGEHTIAQVDLGVRRHRNRPLDELRPMAVDVLRAAFSRYGVSLPTEAQH
jgi:glucosyl-3-phosphoglycerate synthase